MQKRERILEATLKLVLEEGFYHLSMKKVATEAGVAAGTIYLYFSSKEELILELYRSVMLRSRTALRTGYLPERAVLESLQLMMRNLLAFFLERPDCYSFLFQYSMAPFLFKEAQHQRTSLLEMVYVLVEDARRQGLVQDLPAPLLVGLVSGPIIEMVRLWMQGNVDLQQPVLQQQLLTACWAAVIK